VKEIINHGQMLVYISRLSDVQRPVYISPNELFRNLSAKYQYRDRSHDGAIEDIPKMDFCNLCSRPRPLTPLQGQEYLQAKAVGLG